MLIKMIVLTHLTKMHNRLRVLQFVLLKIAMYVTQAITKNAQFVKMVLQQIGERDANLWRDTIE
jgi:hypothetical protein